MTGRIELHLGTDEVWSIPAQHQAQPGSPLPNAEILLRVLCGTDEPNTFLLQCIRGLLPVWKQLYIDGDRLAKQANVRLTGLIWLIDREVAGHTSGISLDPDAQVCTGSYGEYVSEMVWKFAVAGFRYDGPGRRAALLDMGRHFRLVDRLAIHACCGRVRLPDLPTS